jgi:predicted nucleic acid-binding protein
VSEAGGTVPAPWVLDVSVLVAVARADTAIMTLVQELDARGRPVIVPALAVAGASLDGHNDEEAELLAGLERLEGALVAPLRDAEQAIRLAEVIARTGLDPWDAHVGAIADTAACPILTLDAAKWREHEEDLDQRLYFIEVADPPVSLGSSREGHSVPAGT